MLVFLSLLFSVGCFGVPGAPSDALSQDTPEPLLPTAPDIQKPEPEPEPEPKPETAPPEKSTPVPDNSIVSSNTAFEAYYELLSDAVKEHGFGRMEDNNGQGRQVKGVIYAELIDFDNDGVPELLFIYGLPGPYTANCVIYTYSENSAELLGSYSLYLNHAWISIISNDNGISFLSHSLDELDLFYTLANGQWAEVLNREFYEDYEDDEYEWFVNGNRADEQEYEDSLIKYLGSNIFRPISIFDEDYHTVNDLLIFLNE